MFATIRRIGYVTGTTLFYGLTGAEVGEYFDDTCSRRLNCAQGFGPHDGEKYGLVAGTVVGLMTGVAIMGVGIFLEKRREDC